MGNDRIVRGKQRIEGKLIALGHEAGIHVEVAGWAEINDDFKHDRETLTVWMDGERQELTFDHKELHDVTQDSSVERQVERRLRNIFS